MEHRDHQHPRPVQAANHGKHAEPAAERAGHQVHHGGHQSHAGHGGHTDHAAQFRDLFWVSCALALPVVFFSEMVANLLAYAVPGFPGASWISPVLGTVLFFYGGRPFLIGGWSELQARQPGMMLLISMAIMVAFLASGATTLGIGGFDLDFW
jgi:P-type Cu2+ transporter